MIKIIGGKYRSRVINTPEGDTLPTKNMVREAFSSSLTSYLPNSVCLDLFAGSGAVGIEFISRGAKEVYFNDHSKEAYKIINENLAKLQIQGGRVFNLDYLEVLNQVKSIHFDIVFLDPPYALKDSYSKAIRFLIENKMIDSNSVVVLEYEGEISVDDEIKFEKSKNYKYGKTYIRILKELKEWRLLFILDHLTQ